MNGIHNGNAGQVRAYLRDGASVEGSPESPCKPLISAAAAGNVNMVKLLIRKGADVNAGAPMDVRCSKQDSRHNCVICLGERALHTGAKYGRLDVVRALLEAGANPNATDSLERTPLHVALARGKDDHDWLETARELLGAGTDPTLADSDGTIALHHAQLQASRN